MIICESYEKMERVLDRVNDHKAEHTNIIIVNFVMSLKEPKTLWKITKQGTQHFVMKIIVHEIYLFNH